MDARRLLDLHDENAHVNPFSETEKHYLARKYI